jgi:hypothetical protein
LLALLGKFVPLANAPVPPTPATPPRQDIS